MKKKITLEEYLERCEKIGYDPELPDAINNIVDRNYYKPTVIAALTKVSTETARRWFRNGNLKNEAFGNTFKANGKELKEYLFQKPKVYNYLQLKYPEIFE